MLRATDDLRIKEIKPLTAPNTLINELTLTEATANLIDQTRKQAAAIVKGHDDRLLVVIGPCSIHDPVSAMEYASKLKQASERFCDDLCVIMRVYFEKPRTTVGWKGLINDPHLDGSFEINTGLKISRKLLRDINSLGLAAGTEFLDTTIPQFIGDLISWSAIGARTTESQIHREMASGLSMPVGFKNGTAGSIQIAIDAINAASYPHHFLGVTKQGVCAIVSTMGNDASHVILRGSSSGPNYDAEQINQTYTALRQANLNTLIMVDCSHGNSSKNYARQTVVAADLCVQISHGTKAICGVMLESHLVEGRQDLIANKPLIYGKSITDACISWEQSLPILEMLAKAVQTRRKRLKV